MDEFVSELPFKTAPMKVTVTDKHNNCINTYDVPAGFQLERYISKLHPTLSWRIVLSKDKFQVEVYEEENIVETHTGYYQHNI